MTQVFLNYRRTDEPFGVAMLDQSLSSRFGSDAVFLASKSIELGSRWESEMFAAVRRSTALLVVIGRHWLDERDSENKRRIDNPTDFVRREILLAMELDKQIIPIRLETPRLSAKDLPEVLHPLLEKQDIELRFHTHGLDLDRLEAKLRRLIPDLAPPRETRPAGSRTYTGSTHNEFREKVFVDTFNAGFVTYGTTHPDGDPR